MYSRLYLSVIFMCDIMLVTGKEETGFEKRSHGLWKIKSKKVSAGDAVRWVYGGQFS
jgi:hypothetical protein